MKVSVRLVVITLVAVVSMATAINAMDGHFSVKEYDDFHKVLHHLQHEALPKNDMATIRSHAKDLIKLGDTIVKVGVPKGTKAENTEKFKTELENFKTKLVKYGADAESGTDADLRTSYVAVHDSFETLAEMLPRK